MRKSRLSQHKQNKLIELFVAGVTARTAVFGLLTQWQSLYRCRTKHAIQDVVTDNSRTS